MGSGETLLHFGTEVAAKPIHALGHRRHAFRHGTDVMPKILCDHVEMAPGLGGGCVDLLVKAAHLLVKAAHLLVKAAHLLAKAAHLLAKAAHLLAKAAHLLAKAAHLLAKALHVLA